MNEEEKKNEFETRGVSEILFYFLLIFSQILVDDMRG